MQATAPWRGWTVCNERGKVRIKLQFPPGAGIANASASLPYPWAESSIQPVSRLARWLDVSCELQMCLSSDTSPPCGTSVSIWKLINRRSTRFEAPVTHPGCTAPNSPSGFKGGCYNGVDLSMFCSKNICTKFLFFSLVVLLVSVCCNTILAETSTSKKTYKTIPANTTQTVQVQQRTIIKNLKRIEHKLNN